MIMFSFLRVPKSFGTQLESLFDNKSILIKFTVVMLNDSSSVSPFSYKYKISSF